MVSRYCILLEDNRINLRKYNNKGWTPLMEACENYCVDVVKLLLDDERTDINQLSIEPNKKYYSMGGRMFNTYLRAAFAVAFHKCNSDLSIVKLLLEANNLDINKKNYQGGTSLKMAFDFNKYHIVRFLLEQPECNPNEKFGSGGYTIFALACYFGNTKMVRVLLENDHVNYSEKNVFGQTPYQVATLRKNFEVMTLLEEDPRIDTTSA